MTGSVMVDARALWWHPEGCLCSGVPQPSAGWVGPLLIGEINGWTYLTDRVTFVPVARIGGLPVGYATQWTIVPLPPQALEGLATWLNATVIDEVPTRVFASVVVDPLEQAGFLIRPLDRIKDAHGICDPDLNLVGLVMPMARSYNPETPKPLGRVVRN